MREGKNNSFYGKHHSEESKRRISENKKGTVPWNKGIPMTPEMKEHLRFIKTGKTVSEETKLKMSASHKKNPTKYWEGKSLSDEHKEKLSIKSTGNRHSEETKNKIRNRFKGVPKSIEHRLKLRESHIGLFDGKNNPAWKGGVSYFPYCEKFKPIRPQVRAFFNYTCLGCGKPESENITKSGRPWKLSIHHVKFNKMALCDGSQVLLAPLCLSCRSKADNDREGTGINAELEKKIMEQYGGKCFFTKEECEKLMR